MIVTTPSNLDREAVVLAQGTDSLSCVVQYTNATTTTQVQFGITILDQNDVAPRFLNMNQTVVVSLPQTFAVGEAILLLQPTDPDKGLNGTVFFNIVPGSDSGMFKIARLPGDLDPNSTTRMLYLNQSLTKTVYNLSIRLSDMGTPPLTYLQTMIIQVTNNGNLQVSFSTSRVTISVNEKYPVGKTFAILPTVPANLSLSYQVSGGADCCAVYPGGGLYFTRIIDVDHNVADRLLTVTVTVPSGVGGTSVSCIAVITPQDINDHAPYFSIVSSTRPVPFHITGGVASSTLLTVVVNIQDDDYTSPNNVIAISNVSVAIDPSSVGLNSTVSNLFNSLYLVTLGGEVSDGQPVTMTLIASDRGTPPQTGTKPFRIIVDGPPQFLVVNSTSLAEGAPIGKNVLTVNATTVDEGTTNQNTYSIVGVDKMAASNWFLIDNSTGVISVASRLDQAAVNGAVSLTIMAVNAASPPLSSSMTLTINIPPPVVSFRLMSYQYYSGYSVIDLLQQNGNVYLEFYMLKSGTLLWQGKSDGSTLALEIVDGFVQMSSGGQVVTKSSVVVTHEMWYSLLIVSHGSVSPQMFSLHRVSFATCKYTYFHST